MQLQVAIAMYLNNTSASNIFKNISHQLKMRKLDILDILANLYVQELMLYWYCSCDRTITPSSGGECAPWSLRK